MQSNSDYTPQQYRKYNGQMVFKALRAIGSEVSADDLASYISKHIGEREEIVLPEIKQVLRRGIVNGFLVRNGTNYSLVGEEEGGMQVDSGPSRKRHSSGDGGIEIDSNKRHKISSRKLFSNQIRHIEDDYTDEGDEEESDDQEDNWESIGKVKLYEVFIPSEGDTEDEENEEMEYGTSDSEDEVPRRPLLGFSRNIKQKKQNY